jgi:hypothetical protein
VSVWAVESVVLFSVLEADIGEGVPTKAGQKHEKEI